MQPYEGICIVSLPPVEVHWEERKLHKDGGMAVKYSDGWGWYSLNGVVVSEYLATTPGENLDVEFFKTETNAEVRAQFIRKFGIERLSSMGRVIEKVSGYYEQFLEHETTHPLDYELIDMSPIFSSLNYAPYLKMVNPSVGTYHMEGVHPDCKTVDQALCWRAGTDHWNPVFAA